MEFPCDSSDYCLVCKIVPKDKEVIFCDSCDGHWHMKCLRKPLAEVPKGDWYCPECMQLSKVAIAKRKKRMDRKGEEEEEEQLVSKIRLIQSHPHLNEKEKAKILQELVVETRAGRMKRKAVVTGTSRDEEKHGDIFHIFKKNLSCQICHNFPEFVVTTSCGHNFCGACIRHLKTCTVCYSSLALPRTPGSNWTEGYPRTNFVVECAARLAKHGAVAVPNQGVVCVDVRPDKDLNTSNANPPGLANACSGRIYATVPDHYLGPITAEYDVNKRGVRVGDAWENRMALRQSGAHRPHVTAFAGTAEAGCPSVVLSTGYNFDIDHGDYFIWTGCGGCDRSSNKRTGKLVSDQAFIRVNQAMRESCVRGYPVRVIRSCKIMQSKYKPRTGLRYDGIYRIEMCWRLMTDEGIRVCRFLFVRCDNDQPVWRKTKNIDKPRKLPAIVELKRASDITKRKAIPHWDWKAGKWGWRFGNPSYKSKPTTEVEKFVMDKDTNLRRKILRDFHCGFCSKELTDPISTPCGHMFCKSCLDGHFHKLAPSQQSNRAGSVLRRGRRAAHRCPKCGSTFGDIHFEVNAQLRNIIQALLPNTKDSNKPSETVCSARPIGGKRGRLEVKKDGKTEPVLGKKKEVEVLRYKGVRLGLTRALNDSGILSKKKTSGKKLEGTIDDEDGMNAISVDTERANYEDATSMFPAERRQCDTSSDLADADEATGSQNEHSASVCRHYKRRRREANVVSSGTRGKRERELGGCPRGSDALVSDSGSADLRLPNIKRTRSEYVRGRDASSPEQNGVDKFSGAEEVHHVMAGKISTVEEMEVDYSESADDGLIGEACDGGRELSITLPPTELDFPEVHVREEADACNDANANKRFTVPVCAEDDNCSIDDLHGEFGAGPCSFTAGTAEPGLQETETISETHSAAARQLAVSKENQKNCSTSGLDTFCGQMASLASKEGPVEQNLSLVTRCLQEFRQSWTQG